MDNVHIHRKKNKITRYSRALGSVVKTNKWKKCGKLTGRHRDSYRDLVSMYWPTNAGKKCTCKSDFMECSIKTENYPWIVKIQKQSLFWFIPHLNLSENVWSLI